jgi:hypothetical protein
MLDKLKRIEISCLYTSLRSRKNVAGEADRILIILSKDTEIYAKTTYRSHPTEPLHYLCRLMT